MYRSFVLLALFAAVSGQTALQLLANGSLPDGSAGLAVGTGLGANVAGAATVLLNDTLSASSVTLTATGPSTPAPSPKPAPTPVPVEVTPVKPAKKVVVEPKPVCEDIKDMCEDMKKYKKCGYCATEKYPVKGYGCSYTEEVILKKKGDSKKEYEYETVITPKCECKGTYILKASACPTCDSLLAELLECAKVSTPGDVVEIPASCLEKTGATIEFLTKCGFIKAPKPEATPVVIKKEKDPKPEVVVVKPVVSKKEKKEDPKPEVVVVMPDPKPVKKPASATASASATATGSGSASASATATASNKP